MSTKACQHASTSTSAASHQHPDTEAARAGGHRRSEARGQRPGPSWTCSPLRLAPLHTYTAAASLCAWCGRSEWPGRSNGVGVGGYMQPAGLGGASESARARPATC
ncbi:hypothetical protein J1614_004253 [Plenodomus biglobosus]|nr:hypothetical protein J1614_004253 [Plenodomus biglobosus]